MRVRDATAICYDGDPEEIGHVDYIAVHRLGWPDKSVPEVARMFLDHPEVAPVVGCQFPYHFLVYPSGRVYQCLPLNEKGAHARRWNVNAWGIACIGDFRVHEPTWAQWEALIPLCAGLSHVLDRLPSAAVRGHSELPGGSSDPDKVCPGPKLDLAELRGQAELMAEQYGLTGATPAEVIEATGLVQVADLAAWT